MLNRRILALFLVLGAASPTFAQGPYGSIADLKLANEADGKDTASVPAPRDAMVLFDGKSLDGWTKKDGKSAATWKVLDGGVMQVSGGDIITKQKFAGTFRLHVEFRVPYMPSAKGQGRGNSGVYLQGRYEIQVLDSYGLKSQDNDCGGLYSVAAPLTNACKAPTVWQSYDILFQSHRCEGGKIVEAGIVTVRQNGVVIHDKQRLVNKTGAFVTNTTSGLGGDPCSPGPILLQDHGNPVQFRNLWLVQMKD